MSGQDPFADQMNISGYYGGQGPGVMGGLVGQNPYLTYQGKIPMPGINTTSPFTGPVTMGPQDQLPTTAWGTTIQPPYGTTLNQTPQQPQPTPQQPQPNQQLEDLRALVNQNTINTANMMFPNGMGIDSGGRGANTGIANYPGAVDAIIANAKYRQQVNQNPNAGMPQQTPAATTQPAQPQTGLSREQYLYLLANPGKPPSFGADPPGPGQVRTGTGSQPSVIQAFMNAHPGGGTTGAGGYNNQGFFNTLKQLQGGVG